MFDFYWKKKGKVSIKYGFNFSGFKKRKFEFFPVNKNLNALRK